MKKFLSILPGILVIVFILIIVYWSNRPVKLKPGDVFFTKYAYGVNTFVVTDTTAVGAYVDNIGFPMHEFFKYKDLERSDNYEYLGDTSDGQVYNNDPME